MKEQEKWIEEFDKHIKKIEERDFDYDEIGKFIRSDENKLFEEYCYPESIVELDPKKVKQFISDTLQKEQERIVREISKEENEYLFCNCFAFGDGSDSRQEVIKIIQNK